MEDFMRFSLWASCAPDHVEELCDYVDYSTMARTTYGSYGFHLQRVWIARAIILVIMVYPYNELW